jgi:ribosomal silencing factor RsfS
MVGKRYKVQDKFEYPNDVITGECVGWELNDDAEVIIHIIKDENRHIITRRLNSDYFFSI